MSYSKGIVGTGGHTGVTHSDSEQELDRKLKLLKNSLRFRRVKPGVEREFPRLSHRLLTAKIVRNRQFGVAAY